MRQRPAINVPSGVRSFVDDELAALKRSRWSLNGWRRFVVANLRRSAADVRQHPGAFIELSVEHAAIWLLRRKGWTAVSWVMASTHLGLLGDAPRGLGWPNRLSILRANLPVLAPDTAVSGVVELGSDALDGALARAFGDETAFGGYCDVLADLAFWTWFAMRWETNPLVRRTEIASMLAPLVLVMAACFVRGRAFEHPRPIAGRNVQVAMQALLTVRALCRGAG
jgi:hypothetical protein